MFDHSDKSDRETGTATLPAPPNRPGLLRSIAHRLTGGRLALPVEGRLPSFDTIRS
jgi:hypothetical protein